VIVQLNAGKPVLRFEEEGGAPLVCGHCNECLLIENFIPDRLVDAVIVCRACGGETRTAKLSPGETLPNVVVVFGSSGPMAIEGPVTVPRGGMAVSVKYAEAVVAATKPKPRAIDPPVTLIKESLDDLVQDLDTRSGGRFAKHMRSAWKAVDHKREDSNANPLARSLVHLKRKLIAQKPELNLADSETRVAVSIVSGYRHVLYRWGDHPRFPRMAIHLCSEYLHTFGQLILAGYLSDSGNAVGIEVASKNPGADLFIRLNACDRLGIEVRAPGALQRPSRPLTFKRLQDIVEDAIDDARDRKQISRGNPGVLGLVSTGAFVPDLEGAIHEVLCGPRPRHTAFAAISYMGPSSSSISVLQGQLMQQTEWNLKLVKNPHYFCRNPILWEGG